MVPAAPWLSPALPVKSDPAHVEPLADATEVVVVEEATVVVVDVLVVVVVVGEGVEWYRLTVTMATKAKKSANEMSARFTR